MGTLVGRGPALAAARAVLDDAFAGAGQVLLVAGEPGIGKTALLAAVAREAADRGARVLRGICWAGAAPPWWPWTQVLRAADLSPGELGAASALVTHESARSAGRIVGSDPGATAADAADARFRVCEDVVAVLDRLSARAPLVVVLDDLQWADEPSLTLLDFAAAHLGGRPALVLGAYRDTETTGPPLARAQVITLAGLAATEVAAVMATVAGPRPSDEVADRVWRRSGGNPFHVRELTRLLVAGDRAADAVPPTVRDALARRLGRLSAPCAEALTVAALLGPRVWPALLARVLPEVDVAAVLDEAVRARVLVAEPQRAGPDPSGPRGPAGFAFAHDLFRETAAAVAPPRRPDLHARIARALEDLREAGAPVTAAEVATHLVAAHASAPPAGTGPPAADDVAHAVTLCAEAAAEASAGLGYRDACRHLEAALDLLDRVVAPGHTRRALLAELAAARERAGDGPGARAGYRQLAVLARRTGDTAALARAATGVHGLGARTDRDYAESIALLTEAAEALADRPALRARVLAGLARDLVHAGWHAGTGTGRAEETALEAVRLAREVGDPAAVATALLAVHDARWWPGAAGERLTVLDEMARSAERAGDPDLVAQAHQLRAAALLERGEPEGVAELVRCAALAAGLGHARGRHGALTRRAALAVLAGRLAEAAELSEHALELGRAIGQSEALPCFLALRASLSMLGGPPPPADRAVSVPDDDPVAALMPVLRAATLVGLGELEAAGTALTGFDVGHLPDYRDLEFLAITALAVAAAGSPAQRARCYARLAPFTGMHVVVGGCVTYSGPVDLHLGRLAVALGRRHVAAAHLAAAAEQCDRLGAPGWAALARADLDRLGTDDRARATAGSRDPDGAVPGDGPRPDAAPGNVFRREGPVWTACYRGTCVHLPDAKGLHDLATLLANPGVEVHACTLLGRDLPALGADPVLDDRARTAYRRRLAGLDAQLDRADVTGDAAASTRLREERDALVAELAAAAGLRGVPRRLGDETERARKAVTARLRDAIMRIARVHPDLGAHLRAAVSTGVRCRYLPSEPTPWELRPPAGAPPVRRR